MALDPTLEQELFELAHKTFQKSASDLGAIYVPQWNVRNDTAKTLLTISSAVLVISVSLSSVPVTPKWILGACWASFSLAILFAVATLWLSLRLYSLPAFVVYARKELRELIKDFDPDKPHAAASTIVDSLMTRQLNGMEKYDRRATKTLKACLTMFLLGLIFTCAIGGIRLIRS